MAWSFIGIPEPRDEWMDRWAFDPLLADVALNSDWHGGSHWMAFSWRTITAQFVHVDWIHFLGNVAYFFVFGVQVERRVGFVFLVFSTLAAGALAYALPAWFDLQPGVIVAGASGAVSGILGLYFLVCSREPVGIWLPLGLVPQFFKFPAWALIASWFTVQLIFALNATTYPSVAVASHFSGFLVGLGLGLLFRAIEHRQHSGHRKRFNYV